MTEKISEWPRERGDDDRRASVVDALVKRGLGDVLVTIAHHHGVTVDEVVSRSRKRPVVRARHALMRAMREGRKYSYKYIGYVLGFDHSAVMHGVAMAVERSPELREWRSTT